MKFPGCLYNPPPPPPPLTSALRPRVSAEGEHVPSTTASAPMPSYCLTSNGHRYEEGDSWHDGCRDCYCHSGREMCVLISCPVPSCSHPVVRPDQCCPTCEGTSERWQPSRPGIVSNATTSKILKESREAKRGRRPGDLAQQLNFPTQSIRSIAAI